MNKVSTINGLVVSEDARRRERIRIAESAVLKNPRLHLSDFPLHGRKVIA